MIWHTLAFCDPPHCSAQLDHNWASSTTSSTECGGHVDFRCSVFRVAAGRWLCFVFVLVCVCFGFRTCSVSPLALRSLRTAYCAADVVKRQWSKKKSRGERNRETEAYGLLRPGSSRVRNREHRLQDPAAARKEIANLKAMGSPDLGAVPVARKPTCSPCSIPAVDCREVRLLAGPCSPSAADCVAVLLLAGPGLSFAVWSGCQKIGRCAGQ